jgi:hypothetical protein
MILFGALASLVLSALSATSAAAAGAHRPDGWVRYQGFHSEGSNYPNPGAWRGDNIYNTTATNQTVTHKVSGAHLLGDYFYFTVTIQNDGKSDHFKVKGSGASQTKYFKGGTNITSQVKAGTYQTASLAAGAKTTITVRISPGCLKSALVTLTSVADPTKKDAVKARVKNVCCFVSC